MASAIRARLIARARATSDEGALQRALVTLAAAPEAAPARTGPRRGASYGETVPPDLIEEIRARLIRDGKAATARSCGVTVDTLLRMISRGSATLLVVAKVRAAIWGETQFCNDEFATPAPAAPLPPSDAATLMLEAVARAAADGTTLVAVLALAGISDISQATPEQIAALQAVLEQ